MMFQWWGSNNNDDDIWRLGLAVFCRTEAVWVVSLLQGSPFLSLKVTVVKAIATTETIHLKYHQHYQMLPREKRVWGQKETIPLIFGFLRWSVPRLQRDRIQQLTLEAYAVKFLFAEDFTEHSCNVFPGFCSSLLPAFSPLLEKGSHLCLQWTHVNGQLSKWSVEQRCLLY